MIAVQNTEYMRGSLQFGDLYANSLLFRIVYCFVCNAGLGSAATFLVELGKTVPVEHPQRTDRRAVLAGFLPAGAVGVDA